ncbi:MAG: hypothetical protein ACRDD2_02730 [Sarcina sp.]
MKERLELEKRQMLRNNEYYTMQQTFDKLYEQSYRNNQFTDLMQYISSKSNILLAYRNVKNNKGSTTCGTDGLNISAFKDMNNEILIREIQDNFSNYFSRSVKRVEIPKSDGKTRPLGIPCIRDIIIQQYIKQVIEPICGCKTKPSMCFSQNICNYTEEGRKIIHKKLKGVKSLMLRYLENGNEYMPAELFDNSISLIAGQRGVCYITNEQLRIGNMECHHKHPKRLGGTDKYENLLWLSYDAHKLVHSKEPAIINKYLKALNLNKKGLKRLNTLRKLVGNSVI